MRFVQSRYKTYRNDINYKIYITDVLKAICENTANVEVTSRWINELYPPKELDIEAERQKAIKAFSRG